MKITEQELTWLIKESDSEHIVQLSFGSEVTLRDIPSNDWAKRRIEEIRSPQPNI